MAYGENKVIDVPMGALPPTTGSLSVVSNPTGAAISIDGVAKGTTPVTIPNLAIGSHTLTATLAGYQALTQHVTVTAGTTTVPLNLVPATGSLYVTSVPAGADLFVDGTGRGTTPRTVSGLSLGSHTVKVSKAGYLDYTTTATISDGVTTNLDVPLTFVNSDDDGLPDIVEVQGFLDPFGNLRTSDPQNADTDGDGLTDDYEAGYLTTNKDGISFWKVRSNPRMVDSDGDGLDDFVELKESFSKARFDDTDSDGLKDRLEWEIGTDLWSDDSDDDKASDYYEYYDLDPFTDPIVYEERKNPADISRELRAGMDGQPSPSGDSGNSFYRGGIVLGGARVGFGIKIAITDIFHELQQWNEDRPYKQEFDTFNNFLEMGTMLECGGGASPGTVKLLKESVEESPKFYDDAVRLARKIMPNADEAVAEIDEAVRVPAIDVIQTRGFANWKEGEKWLEQVYGGTSQKSFKVIINGKEETRVGDQFANGVAHEMKTGRAYARAEYKAQIDKDIAILKNPALGVTQVEWHFGKSMQTGKVGYTNSLEAYAREACEKNQIIFGTQFKFSYV